jgi:hypothetical protein
MTIYSALIYNCVGYYRYRQKIDINNQLQKEKEETER